MLQGTDCDCKGGACVEGGERGEGATLVPVEEANISSDGGEAGGNNPFKDFRDGLKKNNNAE